MLTLLALLGVGLISTLFMDTEDDFEKEAGEEGEVDLAASAPDFIEGVLEADEEVTDRSTTIIDNIKFDTDFLESRNLIFGDTGEDDLDGSKDELALSADHIFGGPGDDLLIGGDGDVLIGGTGADTFMMNQHDEVDILGLDDEDLIVIRHSGEPPEISGDATDNGTSILADGYPVAHIDGVLDMSRVVLLKIG